MKIVELKEIEKGLNNKIYALLGNDNQTGSIKDITVYYMLKSIKESLKGKTIIEATSGNTGISLAYYQKEFGYKAIIVMPDSMSLERRNRIAKYDATLFLVNGGMEECERKADELLKSIPNSLIFGQFNSPNNPLAHYNITGPFINENLKDIDYLFVCIGTGGTITGTSKYLKEKNKLTTIGIEPFESPLLTKGVASHHLIQGIGANFIPDTLDLNYVDEVITVKGLEAISEAYKIKEKENLFVGISSGASLKGAIDYIIKNNIKDKNILVIFPDSGDRYQW